MAIWLNEFGTMGGVVDAFEDLAIFAVLCKLSQSNQEIFSATLVKVITSLTGSFLCFFFILVRRSRMMFMKNKLEPGRYLPNTMIVFIRIYVWRVNLKSSLELRI